MKTILFLILAFATVSSCYEPISVAATSTAKIVSTNWADSSAYIEATLYFHYTKVVFTAETVHVGSSVIYDGVTYGCSDAKVRKRCLLTRSASGKYYIRGNITIWVGVVSKYMATHRGERTYLSYSYTRYGTTSCYDSIIKPLTSIESSLLSSMPGVSILSTNNGLRITNAVFPVKIYDVAGRLVYSHGPGSTICAAVRPGVYFVRHGDAVKRIVRI